MGKKNNLLTEITHQPHDVHMAHGVVADRSSSPHVETYSASCWGPLVMSRATVS
jgi:hypothetical protein